jgi:hypothetical protein
MQSSKVNRTSLEKSRAGLKIAILAISRLFAAYQIQRALPR